MRLGKIEIPHLFVKVQRPRLVYVTLFKHLPTFYNTYGRGSVLLSPITGMELLK